MKRIIALFLTATAFCFSNMAHAEKENVVAEVNGLAITKDDFDRRYKESLKIFKFTPPTKANVLNEIISFELGVQEAKKLGIDKDPKVQERVNAVLYQSLVEHQLTEKFNRAVDISEKEARDYCKKNPPIRTSHIYVALKTAALKAEEEAAYKKIKEAQAALNSGTPFEKVVAKYSEGYATGSGGDIGFQGKDKLDPTYYMEAKKLKTGAITAQPVRSQFGLHIIKLVGIQDCNSINVPEYQRIVFDEKRTKIFDDYLSGLRSKAKISINKDMIKE